MKTQLTKRLMACLLALTMLATAFAFVIPASAADIAIATDTGMADRIPYRVGKTYSYRANIGADFTGFGFHMPTWEKKTCYATLSMYQWAGSFDATLKTTPVATKKFDPLEDSGCHWVEFTAQPAGEYLFHISDVSADAWQNVLYNRESDLPISFQTEFYENGDFTYRYDLSTINAKIDSGVIPENFPSNITIGTTTTSLFPFPSSLFPPLLGHPLRGLASLGGYALKTILSQFASGTMPSGDLNGKYSFATKTVEVGDKTATHPSE